MTQYNPAPTSLAARVIQHLTEQPGTLTPNEIIDKFGVARGSVSNLLKPAVLAGALQLYSGGKGKTCYHLEGTVPVFDGAAPTPAPNTRKAKKKASTTTRKPREAAPEPATAVPPPHSLAVGRRRPGAAGCDRQRGHRQRHAHGPAGTPGAPVHGAGVWTA